MSVCGRTKVFDRLLQFRRDVAAAAAVDDCQEFHRGEAEVLFTILERPHGGDRMPGPLPKRSDQRRRVNKPDVPVRSGKAQPFVSCPPAKKSWGKQARDWYNSLALSGGSVFYEPADWHTAQAAATLLSEIYANGFSVASQIQAWSAMNSELLATEGARRRARVELHREPVADVPVKVSSRDRDRTLLEAV